MSGGKFRLCTMAMVVIWSVSSATHAGIVVWTGLGADNRWSNPDNWEGGVLPTENDDITFANVDWWENYSSGARRASVTIDGLARARDLVFYHYGKPGWPFLDIAVLPGANYYLSNEIIDQGGDHSWGSYTQSGGIHIVTGDFKYLTQMGNFSMTGGIFVVGGTLTAGQEYGSFSIIAGQVLAQNLNIGGLYAPTSFEIGGDATVTITNKLVFHRTCEFVGTEFIFDSPIKMLGADFVNELYSSEDEQTGFEQMQLVFEGISTFEVAGGDYGPNAMGFVNNFAINILQIGDVNPGFLQLVDLIDNYDDIVIPGNEAQYVDTLIMGNGSILDLNGYNLYYETLIGDNYYFLNGSAILIPEPTTLLLAGLGVLTLLRKGRA